MDTRYIRRAGLVIAALALIACSVPAAAQISSEVQSALRANCRGDATSKCSGLRGQEALACLQKNVNTLSPACKAAVSQTMPKPHSEVAPPAPAAPARAVAPAAAPTPAPARAAVAPAAPTVAAPPPPAPPKAAASAPPAKPASPAAPTAAQQSAMRSACQADFMSHCRGVSPGGKDALACLQHNAAKLSAGCRKVVSATMAAPAPATAIAAAPAAAPTPTPEQMNALKFTCRADFNRRCKGVPPGPEAFTCLQANEARLSPNCRTSVAAIAEEMSDGAAPAIPADTLAPKVGKPSVANAVVMLRACKLDLIRHCHGVKPGDGRELACLAAHESSLSPRCRMAREVTAPIR